MKFNINFSFVGVLTLIFIVLKLMGYITWSWFWVLSPIIFTAIFAVFIFVCIIIVAHKNAKKNVWK